MRRRGRACRPQPVDNLCDVYHKSLTSQTTRHAGYLSALRGRLSV
jgi:hypothetical protein